MLKKSQRKKQQRRFFHLKTRPSIFRFFSNCSKFSAAGSAAIDQVPRQEPGAQPQRPDGGRREAVAVSSGDVRRDPRREPTGGRVRAHRRIPGGVLAGHAPARPARHLHPAVAAVERARRTAAHARTVVAGHGTPSAQHFAPW